ncbi:zinc metalloprotease [Nocardioides sp.]|uniref:zinc metalloprotease n=1 Tax=Nocardioides sp. TaxID=35761 RepID=UPI00286DCFEA|nr:zinc metalloprotease [Nocardioides sp.]
MRPTRLVRTAAVSAVLALSPLLFATTPVFAAVASDGAAACAGGSSGARVTKGATAQEPALYSPNDANKYGLVKDLPTLAAGSIRVRTVFHVITAAAPTPAQRSRLQTMVTDQVGVLNAAFSGKTSPIAANTAFRFDLAQTNFVTNAEWATVTPGKSETAMKQALKVGDSETLNVYAADIGGGLLGWAYFPKDYNNGHDWRDGVVILDESMPGGTAGKYSLGDTLTHEVGHWMMLEHTFAGACSASGDGVADTPREAFPQFDCPIGADTCAAPGLDPIHNFMDYSQDSCMDMFSPGQADRMSDAWQAFRAGGNG